MGAVEKRLRQAAEGDHPEEMLWQLLESKAFWRNLPPGGLFASRQEDDSCGTLELQLREVDGEMAVSLRQIFDWNDTSPLKPLRFRMPGGGGRSLRTRMGVYALATASRAAETRTPDLPQKLARDIASNELLAARASLDDGNYWPRGLETGGAILINLGEKVGLWITPSVDGDGWLEVMNVTVPRRQDDPLPADVALEVRLGDDRNAIRNALRFLALAIELDAAELPEREQLPGPPPSDP